MRIVLRCVVVPQLDKEDLEKFLRDLYEREGLDRFIQEMVGHILSTYNECSQSCIQVSTIKAKAEEALMDMAKYAEETNAKLLKQEQDLQRAIDALKRIDDAMGKGRQRHKKRR